MQRKNSPIGHEYGSIQKYGWDSVAERFRAKVAVKGPDDCWLWQAAANTYGAFWLEYRNVKAHRMAWILHHRKPFPEGMLACHTCDTPLCCNPAHIFLGTHADNTADMIVKGRKSPSTGGRFKPVTHCKRGHEFTPENSGRISTGGRYCRTCKRQYRERRRLERG